jgi:hypothetical protein
MEGNHRMDAQNQNQVQPDYNFILNQDKQSPTQQQPGKKKRKLLLIGGGLFIFGLLVVAAIVATISSNTQNSASNGATSTVRDYLTKVAAADYSGAYDLVSSTTIPSKIYFIEKAAPQFNEVFSVHDCNIDTTEETSGSSSRVSVTCPYKNDAAKTATFIFTVVSSNDQYKITGYIPKNDA